MDERRRGKQRSSRRGRSLLILWESEGKGCRKKRKEKKLRKYPEGGWDFFWLEAVSESRHVLLKPATLKGGRWDEKIVIRGLLTKKGRDLIVFYSFL